MKQTLMQYFEWYLPSDHTLWKKLESEAQKLAKNGFTMLWLPPAYKGQAGDQDVGYGVYDHYDLGEFDAKGSVPTKYGTKDEFLSCIKEAQSYGMKVLGDIVLNHMMGADEMESVKAVTVSSTNRDQDTSDLHDVKVWTKFTFPARAGKYSDFTWNWKCFTGTDYNAETNKTELLLFEGKRWNNRVSKEEGNFDYIMGDDIDFQVPEVEEELYKWGIWYTEMTGVNGFRIDAVKSIDAQFYRKWLLKMKEYGNHPNFNVGEYWSGNVGDLVQYLKDSGHCMTLFDVPFHYNLYHIAQDPDHTDLRHVFDQSLTDIEPEFACAFSDNHDTQPGQALYSFIPEWFKPLSYAFILLNNCLYPCVFYGDYYGIEHDNIKPTPYLKEMVWIRQNLLGGDVVYFNDDDPQKNCWMVPGDHPVLVLLSSGGDKKTKVSDFSLQNLTFVSITEPAQTVTMDDSGAGELFTYGHNLAVYILKEDYDRMQKAMQEIE